MLLLGQESTTVHGLLPTRGSLMLDFVFLAMFAVLPLLGLSIYLVRRRRQYQRHKWLQLGLAITLLLAVLAFEIDMRFFTDWEELAASSPFYQPGTWNAVWYSLTVHLGCAVPTLVLWIYVIARAWRGFPVPAAPSAHSRAHVFWARLAAIGMTLTAVTGWIFYWLAFVS